MYLRGALAFLSSMFQLLAFQFLSLQVERSSERGSIVSDREKVRMEKGRQTLLQKIEKSKTTTVVVCTATAPAGFKCNLNF